MRCLPGVKVEAGVVAGVVVRGPGRQADPVGIAVLVDAAGVGSRGRAVRSGLPTCRCRTGR
jgi:hypothetical protein